MDVHVVSNGFEFYIREDFMTAGIYERVTAHTGVATGTALTYAGPIGKLTLSRFKEQWTEQFLRDAAGSSTSATAPQTSPPRPFATSYSRAIPSSRGLERRFPGALRPFDTLHDIARGLQEIGGA